MKFLNVICSIVLLFLSFSMSAQNAGIIVSGQVLDSVTGESVPFAGVFIKGTTTGVSTDEDGFFSISAPSGGGQHS